MYGTAWKEEETQRLTRLAIDKGFRAIDTANQRKHYYEAAVGDAIKSAIDDGVVQRKDLFLQTKYTYAQGQDDRLPYDPAADYATQVQQSFEKSLEHLHTDYIDSYVLHGPHSRLGLSDVDWQVWGAMEEIHKAGKTKILGVSNVNYKQLESLLKRATVKPHFVQNRCFARGKWDKEIRQLCQENSVVYQAFSLLTANKTELSRPAIQKIVEKYQKTLPQVVFRFAIEVGMMPLTGTTKELHMEQDLQIYDFELTGDEMKAIENIATTTFKMTN